MVDQSTDRERSSFNECGIDCMGVMVKHRQLRLKLTAFPSLMARLWSMSWAEAFLSSQTKLFAPFQSGMPYRFLPVMFRHHSVVISVMITVMDPVLEVRTSLMTSIESKNVTALHLTQFLVKARSLRYDNTIMCLILFKICVFRASQIPQIFMKMTTSSNHTTPPSTTLIHLINILSEIILQL